VKLADLLADAIDRLDRAGIPYMLRGSLASTYHGEPRATRDLDLVIDPRPRALERLVDGLEADGFYVDREAARTALRDRTQFNAIGDAAAKIDFIIRKDRPFSVEEFRRRRRVELLGTSGFIVSVEDLIVAKLEWAAATGSERQLRDVAGMLAVAGDAIDAAYLNRWIAALGLTDTWTDVVSRQAGG
jgi:hypothetical protein